MRSDSFPYAQILTRLLLLAVPSHHPRFICLTHLRRPPRTLQRITCARTSSPAWDRCTAISRARSRDLSDLCEAGQCIFAGAERTPDPDFAPVPTIDQHLHRSHVQTGAVPNGILVDRDGDCFAKARVSSEPWRADHAHGTIERRAFRKSQICLPNEAISSSPTGPPISMYYTSPFGRSTIPD